MAVKILKELGVKPTQRIRIIAGGDEETGFDCVTHYKQEQEIPAMSYTPDANFPCIYAEKGILQMDLTTLSSSEFTIETNNAYNAVCDRASYSGDNLDLLKEKLIEKN